MKNIMGTIVAIQLFVTASIAQPSFGPGYKWELFKHTPVWDLVEAVAAEDTTSIYSILDKGKINIDFQEPKFGMTPFLLAVSNSKIRSAEALLKAGAKIEIKDSLGEEAIHLACEFIQLKSHPLEMIRLLIKYGANVNAVAKRGSFSVPLEGAVASPTCTKLLLEHGANPYYRDADDSIFKIYDVWINLLSHPFDSSIFVAKYMIMERKLKIPNPITLSLAKHRPLDVFYFLNGLRFNGNMEKEQTKKELIAYLHKMNFPHADVFIPRQ
jgi:ankyrin repeat protein